MADAGSCGGILADRGRETILPGNIAPPTRNATGAASFPPHRLPGVPTMGLPLTPALIAGAYEFLRLTPPFKGWKLPPAGEIEFVVSRHRNHVAYHRGLRRKTRAHEIGISEVCVGHTDTLLRAMAHEMIHQ